MRTSTMVSLSAVLSIVSCHVTFAEGSVPPVAASADATTPIAVGDTVPPITVRDGDGAEVSLNELLAKQKTALVFYRGGWCPFCNKHLGELASIQDEITSAGYQVIGINADSPEDVVKAQELRKYPFTILSDSDLNAARAFGVAFKLDDETVAKYQGYGIKLMDSAGKPRYALPVPAFYLIDTDGKITFEHHDPDYSKRISKADILKAVQAD